MELNKSHLIKCKLYDVKDIQTFDKVSFGATCSLLEGWPLSLRYHSRDLDYTVNKQRCIESVLRACPGMTCQ